MVAIQDGITFEWDDNKEQINIRKHNISFDTAMKVFRDNGRVEMFDEAHSEYEDRFLAIGIVGGNMLMLTVSYTERGNALRLISARKATRSEREYYYDN